MSSPSTSPSILDKLPVELLKRIVELVREQDERTKTLPVRCANPPSLVAREEDDSSDDEEDQRVSIEDGHFPSAYGMGVSALSLTNKKLRHLALPHLFHTLKTGQVEKRFFRYFVLTSSLAHHIKTLNLDHANEGEVIAAAQAVPLLPNLRTVRIGYGAFVSVVFPDENSQTDWRQEKDVSKRKKKRERAELRDIARSLFSTHFSKFTHLDLHRAPIPTALRCLELAGHDVHHVSLSNEAFYLKSDTGDRLRTVLHQLSPASLALEENVTYHPNHQPTLPDFLADLSLPNLTSLSLPLSTPSAAPLLSIEPLASNTLTHLTLDVPGHPCLPPAPFQLSLPRLQHLSFQILSYSSHTRLLSALSQSPLLSLSFQYEGLDEPDCADLLPLSTRLPPTLRSLSFDVDLARPPTDYSAYSSARAGQGIICSLNATPRVDTLTCHDSDEEDEDDDALAASEKKEVVDETLNWARRQADTLCLTGDKVGLQHLGEALIRVKELKMLAEV
ncbi:hypothetical protein JCM6882_007880 [Rhodosporidiobolus microsporus]